jgi:hypothetical protein
MRAVINLEAVFAVLVILGACARALRSTSTAQTDSTGRRYWLLLLLVIPAALLWTLTFPLVSDDYIHIGFALHFTPDKIGGLFTIPAGDHFFRPLGYLSYALDALWAGHSAALWHLATLLIHFANCVLVYLIASQARLARIFAATAAVLFGIHGSRPEAVTWIACRFDLLATLFVLLTLWLFVTSTRQGSNRPLIYAAALVTAFLGLISKEAAYVLPVLLLIITERPLWRRVAPFAALTGAVFIYRWHLLSGIGGYQTSAHTPAIFNFSLVRTANALFLRLWATLFFPLNWTESKQWWLLIAIGAGLVVYVILGLYGRRDRRTLTFLTFAFIAALPVQQLLLIGPDLEKSRILYLPSVGFALFLAAVLQTLQRPDWRIPAALAMICFQAACLQHNLITWRGIALIAQRACDTVAAAMEGNRLTVTVDDLPNVVRGVYFLHEDMGDCLTVWHGVDAKRLRENDTDVVFHWDPQSETVKSTPGTR